MTDKRETQNESLMTFPCDFTIKVIGLDSKEFETTVLMIVHKHVPNLSDRAIQSRPSENGKYIALTINVHVDTKAQLDSIYQELSSSPQVIMAI